jgi:ABC-type nitrate/sulfonate/bicarbonate transport system substrate-binding protein
LRVQTALGRAIALVSALSVAAAVLSGCGGGSAPSSGPGSPRPAASGPASSGAGPASGNRPLSLKIGVGSAATNYGAFWVAQANHLFAKNGLEIHVVSYATSGTTANVVSGGLVQLQLFTAPLGLELAEHGKPITIVDELSSFNAGAMVVIGARGVTSPSQLRSLKNCRIATIAQGTVPYAYAIRYLRAEGLSNCALIQESTPPPLIAAVSSGSAQAGIVTYSNAVAAISSGAVTMLLDPLKVPPDLAKKLVPEEYPAFVVFGLRSTVRANREAVVRFVRALRQANAMLLKTPAAELGAETAALPAFAGAKAPALAQAWKGTLSQIPTGPKAGFISKAAWKTALGGYSEWGLPGYSATNPALSYGQVVDMSYFDQAG